KPRDQYSARRERTLLSYETALANRARLDWTNIAQPSFVGRRTIQALPLDQLIPFIDWTFFFAAWELKGRFPAILDHPQYGKAARELYDNARALLDRIVRDKLMTANGVFGFWPAASDGDDIVVYGDQAKRQEIALFNL